LSAETELLAQPESVFNFTVTRAHAYFAGLDQVLVHNGGCGESLQTLMTRLEESERELRRLQQTPATTPEQAAERQARIAELKKNIRQTKIAITAQRKREHKAEQISVADQVIRDAEPRHQAATSELDRAREALRALEGGRNSSDERTKLKQQITQLEKEANNFGLDLQNGRELKDLEKRLEELLRSKQPSEELAAVKKRIGHLKKLLRQRKWEREEKAKAGSLRARSDLRRHLPRSRPKRPSQTPDQVLAEELESTASPVREVLLGESSAPDFSSLIEQMQRELAHEAQHPVEQIPLSDAERELFNRLEAAQGELRSELDQDSARVDDSMEELLGFLRTPSPEHLAEASSTIQVLQDELAQERNQLQANDLALAHEESLLIATLKYGGSSRAPAALERIRSERIRLRSDWESHTRTRLDDARRQLHDMRSRSIFRDEELEGELAQTIELLERELADPPFSRM
jgi:hypothetical protein